MSVDFWGTPAALPVPAARAAHVVAAPPNTWGFVPPATRAPSWAEIIDAAEPPEPPPLPHSPRAKRTALVALRTLLACVTIGAAVGDAFAATQVIPTLLPRLLG